MSNLIDNLNEIKNQKDAYLLPENLKKGVTCLGVEGAFEGGASNIKLFETEEEMNSEPDKMEGNFAVVYGEDAFPIKEDSEFDILVCPETVTLSSAITSSKYLMFRASGDNYANGEASISSTSFRFSFYNNDGSGQITYTSSDGITYTRTDTLGNPVNLGGTVIFYPMYGTWDDVFGNFMLAFANTFGGLFLAKSVKSRYENYFCTNITNNNDEIITCDYTDLKPTAQVLNLVFNETGCDAGILKYIDGVQYTVYTQYHYQQSLFYGVPSFIIEGNIMHMGWIGSYYKMYKIDVDLATGTCVKTEMGQISSMYHPNIGTFPIYLDVPTTDTLFFFKDFTNPDGASIYPTTTYKTMELKSNMIVEYFPAPNQFDMTSKDLWNGVIGYGTNGLTVGDMEIPTLTSANQLLPGISAVGSNKEVIAGDGSIYSNMSEVQDNNNEIYTHKEIYTPITSYSGGAVPQCAIGVGTNIYLFGGVSKVTDFYKYDTLTDTYTKLGDLPSDIVASNILRGGFGVCGNTIYLVPGRSSSVWAYDTLTDTWTAKANFPSSISSNDLGSCACIDSHIYYAPCAALSYCLYVYDVSTDTYTQKSNMPNATNVKISVARGTDIYMFDAQVSCRYDTLTDTYTEISCPDINSNSSNGRAFVIGDDIHIFCYSYNNTSKVSEPKHIIYNIATDTYIESDNCPATIYYWNTEMVGDYVYLFHGETCYKYYKNEISYLSVIEQQNIISNDLATNLIPENIKKGVTILGVTGTLEV